MNNLRKRKIIVTVGPSSFNEARIREMERAGVDIFRINLSHTKIEDLKAEILQLQSWTTKPICIDTEGAQIRTGVLPKKTINLETNAFIEIVSSNNTIIKRNQIPVTLSEPSGILNSGDILRIDYNGAILQIISCKLNNVLTRVIYGGTIGTNKAISVDRNIDLPAFTQKDKQALKLANILKLKTVAFSFASSGKDIQELRSYFDYKIFVISKIENKLGLKNLQNICENSDAILIDRGDLSHEIPLEKIIFAQSFIIEEAKKYNTPVYVATNFMESMILNPKPTRAEIHDVIATLNQGANGLVLAAETAIGKYPAEAVKMTATLIDEVDNNHAQNKKYNLNYLSALPDYNLVKPHGGILIRQYADDYFSDVNLNSSSIPPFVVSDQVLADAIQIAEGVYSPLSSFMDINELNSVLDNDKLQSGVIWTLPILFQAKKEFIKQIPERGEILLKKDSDENPRVLLRIQTVEKLETMEKIAKKWFGTTDKNHPGVLQFLNNGQYLIAGQPFLIRKKPIKNEFCYELFPRQTRRIFGENGWHNIVGFHTRNVCHRGHEYIQKKALKETSADAMFISPVTGKKKSGDFTSKAIINCYQEMINKGYYNPYRVLLGTFSTFSRYSGPREAVFTAICRKNFGCNIFIIGRDHTGVGNYYEKDASQKIFDKLNIGIKILCFPEVYYCKKCQSITDSCMHDDSYKKTLSGSRVRQCLEQNKNVDNYLMKPDISELLKQMYKNNPDEVIEK